MLLCYPGDRVYNIGCGEGKNNKDILEAVQSLARAGGLEIKLNTLPLRK
jgi:hypothetical protein